jgi:6,7-dimethyl-8-ribityllumazine synthase
MSGIWDRTPPDDDDDDGVPADPEPSRSASDTLVTSLAGVEPSDVDGGDEDEDAEIDGAAEIDRAAENVLEGWPEPRDELHVAGAEEPDAAEETGAHEEPALSAVEHSDPGSGSAEHAPGELTVPPGFAVLEGIPRGGRAVGIVVSRFNGDVTTKLLAGALDELAAHGVAHEAVTVMPVPGAFELPLAAMALAKTRRFACIVALGCVIRGDTPHFEYVASEAASGLQLAAIETGVPVAFGVLTLDRADQAEPRLDKGAEAVRTALEMADLFANLRAAAASR